VHADHELEFSMLHKNCVLNKKNLAMLCFAFYFIYCKNCDVQVYFLEWTDDLEGFVLKGYGESINYRMGLPLLKDVMQSIEEAVVAKEGICIF
jgi:hypothetical protein